MKFVFSDFGFSYPKNVIFDRINLTLTSDERYLLTGENGSGKTTFCKLFMFLLKEYSGLYRVYENETLIKTDNDIYKKIHFIQQEPLKNLIGSTPDEDLSIWQHEFSKKDTPQMQNARIEALDFYDILTFKDTPTWKLSTGQQKSVALSSFLLVRSSFWVLDEPANGIDQVNRKKLIKMLKNAENGFIIVSHNQDIYKELDPVILQIEGKNIFKKSL